MSEVGIAEHGTPTRIQCTIKLQKKADLQAQQQGGQPGEEGDSGHEQKIDFKPVLVGELYAPLEDEKMYNQVEIDPEVHTLVWPNGADFDPETLHNWPEYVENMRRLAKQSEIKKTRAM